MNSSAQAGLGLALGTGFFPVREQFTSPPSTLSAVVAV